MELRLRELYVIIGIFSVLLLTSCSYGTDDVLSSTTESSVLTEDSVVSTETIQTRQSIIDNNHDALEDGRYLVRFYTCSDNYADLENGIDVEIGIVDGSSTIFYRNDDVFSHNIGDYFVVDDDLKIKIDSLDIQDNCFIFNRFFEPGEEFIRLSYRYIFVRPDSNLFGVSNNIDDYWVLGRLEDTGNYQYVGEYIGKTTAHIAEECVIKIWDHDNAMWNYDDNGFNEDGLPIPHTLSTESMIDFITNIQSNYGSPICIEAIIEISNGEIVYIENVSEDIIVEAK